MQKVFSVSAQQVFIVGVHEQIPEDAQPITDDEELEFVGNRPQGHRINRGADGDYHHVPEPAALPTSDALCQSVDVAADAARTKVVGDPLRAEEYQVAAAEARAFQDAGYAGPVPRSVAAWAINGRTPEQAANSILAKATAYTDALYFIRETRLQAKELIRSLMAEKSVAEAQDVAAEAIAAIEASVAGVENTPLAE